ncbi:Target of rapamycin complex subunit lst8 [Dermatophagoides farinae]|uniref:Target of rapamycin complex subunit lst8 n=1 Tax=Dermatophagoides farinae TaxID=6954 RepID=A0A922L243_DERFA|nr:Target of rapamycin complex subunit lst8 [Dermatophagoides farinae]
MQKVDTRHTYQQMIQQHQAAAQQNYQPSNQLILASGGYDNTIRMWNVDKGFCDKSIQNPDNSHVNALAITPTRELLASAGFQHIRLYDVQSNASTPLINFEGISKNVSSIGFSPNTTFMYTGGEDFYARIWDIRSRRLTCQRHCGLKTPINSLFLHPNEIEIYIADQSGSIWIWNLQNDQLQRLFVTNDGFIQHIAYDKECRLLAAIDTLGKCYIFRNTSFLPPEMLEEKNGEMTASGYLHRRLIFQAHDKYGLKCCFSPDSTLLATSSADTTVKFWRTSDLSIVNSTNTIQIDDPSELKANQKPKSQTNAVTYEQFIRYKDLWHNTDDGAGTEFDPAAVAMLGAPFLARLFPWKKIKPQKPPRCYLKRRRHNHTCNASNRNTCCKYVNNNNNNSNNNNNHNNNNNNNGRLSANGCALCAYRDRSLNNILRRNINTTRQSSFYVVNGKEKNSVAGSGRLSSTDPLNSPVRTSLNNHNSMIKTKNGIFGDSMQSSLNDLKQYYRYQQQNNYHHNQNHHHHHHHHHHNFHHSQFGGGNQLYQSVYTKYLDNDYNELFNKLEDISIHNGGTGNGNNGNITDIFTLERQEDEEFLNIIKELKLVDSDFDCEYDDEINRNDNGHHDNGHDDDDDDDVDDESDDEADANDDQQTEGHYSFEMKTDDEDEDDDEDLDDDDDDDEVDEDDDDDDDDDGSGDIVKPPKIENNKKNYIGKQMTTKRSISATNSLSNSSSRSNSKHRNHNNNQINQQQNSDCCCSCDCFKKEKLTNGLPNLSNHNNNNNFIDDNDHYENGGGESDDNNNGGGNSERRVKKKQKNEWSLTEQITPFQTLKRPNQKWVWDLAFSADSQYVFTASSDHYVRLWSVYSGQMTREYSGHQKAVTALAFSDVFVE